ncbi:hypothetical protein CJO80_27070 (plasmid) [Ralstonia solanacearum]|nr:hypothetical protein CJO80_27070 [Ralstonia solanacearum]
MHMPTAAQPAPKRSITKPAGKKPAAKAGVAKNRVSKNAVANKAVARKQPNKAAAGVVHIVSTKGARQSVADVVKELAQSYGFKVSAPRAQAAANPYEMSAKEANRVLRDVGVVTKSGKLSALYK